MSEYVIHTQQLTRRFGKREFVKRINLQVPGQQIYGFLGPNGAGKTTTIRMLLGLIKSTSGEIEIFGKKLKDQRMEILKDIGSLVESPAYYAHLSAYRNLEIVTTMRGLPTRRIHEVLDLVRLAKDAYRPVKGYSLGMRQRLGIAMALIANPKLLILDEPTNGLDPSGIQEIRELIMSLPGAYGMTVLVSSHLLSEIEQIATYVGIINQGEMIFQGTMKELTAKSKPQLFIETPDPVLAAGALIQHGWTAGAESIEQNEVVTPIVDRQQSSEMIKVLVEHNHPIYRVTEKKKTLEEIFLELTGKERSL
ncbi:ABC transporter ATP-binding protein [Paenibacillus polymyxa]|uniref:ABC transporter ATP-binding protein n=1 Tax=Paenibacillus polymyxa TaxID=1406 RepID=UPI0004D43ADA|nr:ABC transporter ATP-binding protein [Paenibacillus polymyxa]KEO80465.1 bacitracin ABC transporter ATP-binding protein [Paenibacillus polymyxa]MCH6186579.1 ABC transporter ATP-binding protein [Paenibacillus polymyxa]WRL60437.1 ABC transporter ATP-binding protein [Paenibacillus polymyxa]